MFTGFYRESLDAVDALLVSKLGTAKSDPSNLLRAFMYKEFVREGLNSELSAELAGKAVISVKAHLYVDCQSELENIIRNAVKLMCERYDALCTLVPVTAANIMIRAVTPITIEFN